MVALSIPNPHTEPKPWDTLEFQGAEVEQIWPPETDDATERYGIVEWSAFKAKAKIDKKAKAGAAKPKVSQVGGQSIDFSFTLVVVQSDEALESVAPILDLLRVGAGPYVLKRHPWAALVGITDFIVETVDLSPPSDGTIRIQVSCTQVDSNAQAGKGGNASKTPGEKSDTQKALDDFNARRERAEFYAKQEQLREIVAERAAAEQRSDLARLRATKKLASTLAGADEVDVTTSQATESNAVTGKIGE